jgi:predicted anti-sigma-YlaC factor YlaD
MDKRSLHLALSLALLPLLAGCSLRTLAVNQLGNALAGGGSTFAADEDPDLVGDALPFSLKLMESLLAESPRHEALLVAAARGFTQYSYGWVDPADDPGRADRRLRARRLYLRARDYGMRALAVAIDGFEERLPNDPRAAVARAQKRDVPALYWTAASWGLAIALSKDDPEMLADLPAVDAMIARAAELDPEFESGAIDTFLITWEAARSGLSREAAAKARQHYRLAVHRSAGRSAAPFVAAAEALSIPAQDRAEFDTMIERALAVDPNAEPLWKLQNILSRRRAEWLRAHADDYFFGGQ